MINLNCDLNSEEKDLLRECMDSWDTMEYEAKNQLSPKLKNIVNRPIETAFEILDKNNITRLQISFSGGNDDGGSDGCCVYVGESDNPVNIDLNNCDIASILEKPIYDKYYGFGFNGDVTGICIWEIKKREIYLRGTEQTYNSVTENIEL